MVYESKLKEIKLNKDLTAKAMAPITCHCPIGGCRVTYGQIVPAVVFDSNSAI